MKSLFLLVVIAVGLFGCGASPEGSGHMYQQGHAVANLRSSGLRQIEKVTILYPGSQRSDLQRHLLSSLVDELFLRSISNTTERIDSELSRINAETYLKRFDPSHVLWLYLPHVSTLNGKVQSYKLDVNVIDVRSGQRVWTYRADVVVGTSASVRDVTRAMLSELQRDGVLPSTSPSSRSEPVTPRPDQVTNQDGTPQTATGAPVRSAPGAPVVAKPAVWANTYADRIRVVVRSNLDFPAERMSDPDMLANPRTEIEVRTATDGRILSTQLKRSSGAPDWDAAVQKAIVKAGYVPLDSEHRVPPTILISYSPR